jgi:hypothetical protein
MSRIVLTIVLSISLIATACSAQWISEAPGRFTRAHADVNQNLPASLQAAHINHAALSTRITAAVNLIVTTVGSFAALIPQSVASARAGSATSGSADARTVRQGAGQQNAPRPNAVSPKPAIPGPKDLKKLWNQQVCAPSGNAALDAVLSERALK